MRIQASPLPPGPRRWLATLRVRAAVQAYRIEEPGQMLATPDGSLLVAERGLRDHITLVHPQDGSVSVFAGGLRKPYGLAFAPDRTVLVSTPDGIFRVPAHGGAPRRLVRGEVGPMVPVDERTIFYGRPDEVGRLDLQTGAMQAFGPPVDAPHSLVRAGDGRLFVTDTDAGRIVAVDPASGAWTAVAQGLRIPLGMIEGVSDELLVLEYAAGVLTRIGAGGARITVASGLHNPYSVTLGRDGNYYVAEVGDLGTVAGTLKRVTPEGRVSVVRLHRARS